MRDAFTAEFLSVFRRPATRSITKVEPISGLDRPCPRTHRLRSLLAQLLARAGPRALSTRCRAARAPRPTLSTPAGIGCRPRAPAAPREEPRHGAIAPPMLRRRQPAPTTRMRWTTPSRCRMTVRMPLTLLLQLAPEHQSRSRRSLARPCSTSLAAMRHSELHRILAACWVLVPR